MRFQKVNLQQAAWRHAQYYHQRLQTLNEAYDTEPENAIGQLRAEQLQLSPSNQPVTLTEIEQQLANLYGATALNS